MSAEFITYASISIVACSVSLLFIRWRNIKDPTRLVGWYLAVFIVTYLVRPAGTQITGDTYLYWWFGVSGFEQNWIEMTSAVVLSISSFAIGYRLEWGQRKSKNSRIYHTLNNDTLLNRKQTILIACILIVWGYFSIFLSGRIGGYTTGGISNIKDFGNVSPGIAQGTTFWLLSSDLFISTGSIILYIATERLSFCLIPSIPWLVQRVFYGYERITIISYFIAVFAIWLIKKYWVKRGKSVRKKQLFIILIGILITVFLLFPGMRMQRNLFAEYNLIESVKLAWNLNFIADTWFSTTSDVSGFEPTIYHLEKSGSPVWGTYYLYFYFLKPIPRMLWPEKPYPWTLSEKWLEVEFDPYYFGFAPGSIGMAFYQWGWIGIPFEFLFTGWFFRRVEEWVRRRANMPYALVAYAGIFSLLPQLGRDSLLYMIADRWLFVYGIPVFLLWLIQKHAMTKMKYAKAL